MKQISAQLSAKRATHKLNAIRSTLYPDQQGMTALAALTIIGLVLAISLALIGTGTIKLPGQAGIPVSPIPVSDPIEDDEACNDPYNADCEKFLENDPENLTPQQIQKELEN